MLAQFKIYSYICTCKTKQTLYIMNPKHIIFIAFAIIILGLTYGVFFAFNVYVGSLIIISSISLFLLLVGKVIEDVDKFEDKTN